MNSMTGFGRGRLVTKSATLEITLSCINKRGLEIAIALPRELGSLEGAVFDQIKDAFERGKFQLTARLDAKKDTAPKADITEQFKALKASCQKLKVPFTPSADLVARLMQTQPAPTSIDADAFAADVKKLTATVIAATQKAQASEGTRLKADFTKRLKLIAGFVAEAKKLAAASLPLQRERLLKNLEQAGLTLDPNDERVLKELALFADRVDITEELTRITSHIQAATELINSTKAIGRPLEFLLQEFQREWNTLGNKSVQLPLVQLALAAKNEIEKMKEQAANIA